MDRDGSAMDAKEHDLLLDYIESHKEPESNLFERSSQYRAILPTPASNKDEGYDESLFVGDPDEDLKCPICLAVAKNPVQTPCGHIFCGSCFKKLPK